MIGRCPAGCSVGHGLHLDDGVDHDGGVGQATVWTRQHRRRLSMPGAATALAVVLVIGSCVLTGCGAGSGAANPAGLPTYDPNAAAVGSAVQSTSASTTRIPLPKPTITPSPGVKYTPADPLGEGAWVERGKVVAGSAQKRAAVAAVVKYLSIRVQVSNTWTVDQAALAAVASGQALTSAQERAQHEKERDWRAVGRLTVNISSVQLNGSHATVTGCHFDGTSELDENGQVVIGPPGGIRLTMKLLRTNDIWRVVKWPDHKAPACDDWSKGAQG